MEAERSLKRDWSSLPPEVLNLIAKDLTEVPDFVRFRAVCPAWRFSTPVTDLSPQFPWILQTWRSENDTNLKFYSMSADKVYTIPDPKSMDSWPYEMSEGYLFAKHYDRAKDTSFLSLINPLNNDEIPFPACMGQLHCLRQRCNQIGEYGVCCVLHHQDHESELVHYRLDQNQWCELIKYDYTTYRKYDHFYLKGMLFGFHKSTGVTKVIDISTASLAYVVPPIGDPFTVESCTLLEALGDILGVFTLYDTDNPGGILSEVHRLDLTESGSPCWVKIKNIGNHALFFDSNGVFILEANDLAGIKANCIYDVYVTFRSTVGVPFVEVRRIDIQTGTEQKRRCLANFSNQVDWFVPNLCHLQAI